MGVGCGSRIVAIAKAPKVADTLTTITKVINSPPGQLAAGGVLAGIVWKFFERVEAVLTVQASGASGTISVFWENSI